LYQFSCNEYEVSLTTVNPPHISLTTVNPPHISLTTVNPPHTYTFLVLFFCLLLLKVQTFKVHILVFVFQSHLKT